MKKSKLLSAILAASLSNAGGRCLNLGTKEVTNDEWRTWVIKYSDLVTGSGTNVTDGIFYIGGHYSGIQHNNYDIDDFTVYHMENGKKVTDYENNFDGEDEGSLTSELAAIFSTISFDAAPIRLVQLDVNIVADRFYFTAEDATEISYTVPEGEEITLVPGRYVLHGSFYYPNFDGKRISLISPSAQIAKADNNFYELNATLIAADGEYATAEAVKVNYNRKEFEYAFIISEETTIKEIRFEAVGGAGEADTTICYRNIYIEGFTQSIEGDDPDAVDVQFKNITVEFREGPEKPGFPDIGVVMLLVAKRRAAEFGVRTEFIKNGKLFSEPVIHDNPASAEQSVENAGWYAGLDNIAAEIEYITDGLNGFIRVSNIDANQRGVWYNTGVILPAGTYTFKVDMRVSETVGYNNYSTYSWRTPAKDMQSMRANLQDPANIANSQYEAGKPVDTDTVLNDSGIAVGNCVNVTRDWTTYVDTIVLEEPTLTVFKISSGIVGVMDSHGFDIDNLSIVGYVKAN